MEKQRSRNFAGGRWMRRIAVVGLAAVVSAAIDGGVWAGGPISVASASASSGLVITSFAVPVGVPVTPLNVPGVLFAYSQPAIPAAAPRAAAPGACACGECKCNGKTDERSQSARMTTQEVESSGAAVLRQRCAKCHTGAEAKEHVRLFEDDGVLADDWQRHAQAMFEAVIERRMPKGGVLSAEEKVQLIEWLVGLTEGE